MRQPKRRRGRARRKGDDGGRTRAGDAGDRQPWTIHGGGGYAGCKRRRLRALASDERDEIEGERRRGDEATRWQSEWVARGGQMERGERFSVGRGGDDGMRT